MPGHGVGCQAHEFSLSDNRTGFDAVSDQFYDKKSTFLVFYASEGEFLDLLLNRWVIEF